MIEFKSSNKPRIAMLLNNQVEVTFTTSKASIKDLEALNDKELLIQVKDYKPRRSMSQNAYMWSLLNELAIKMNISKEDAYKSYIKDYGVFEILPLRNDAVDTFKSKWGKNGIGWFVNDLGESKLKGYTNLIAYYGSSTYTTSEMKRVLDAIINDCEEMGISTMTLNEIMLLRNENDVTD